MLNFVLMAFALLGGGPVFQYFPLFTLPPSRSEKGKVRYWRPILQTWNNSRFGLMEEVFVIWNKNIIKNENEDN